jgi:hypothetical protein
MSIDLSWARLYVGTSPHYQYRIECGQKKAHRAGSQLVTIIIVIVVVFRLAVTVHCGDSGPGVGVFGVGIPVNQLRGPPGIRDADSRIEEQA